MLLHDYVSAHCGTGPMAGLVKQICDTLTSELPAGTLTDISAHVQPQNDSTITLLQSPGAETLVAAILEKGHKLPLFHALRVLPQQYAFRTWLEQGRCSIPAAAKPGRSNHERGNAIDVDDLSSWKSVLNHHGWIQTVSGDPSHFEFNGEHDSAFNQKGILAFQKLWNKHNPNDPIEEDGTYGPETEKRLKASPIAGF
jgi:hypothetical protein